MKLVVFGLTVSSSWGNGHATLWRGLWRAWTELGHNIVFFEHDVPYYAEHRDIAHMAPGELVLYGDWNDALPRIRPRLAGADVAMVTSYCPDAIAAASLIAEEAGVALKVFYDMDTPVTLEGIRSGQPVAYIGPRGLRDFDLVLSYTGGPALGELRSVLGAPRVRTLYGHVDPRVHRCVKASSSHRCALSYLGTYATDRQAALDALFIAPARHLPQHTFLAGGAQYPAEFAWPPNVNFVRHMPPAEHPAFFSSARWTLNVTRRAMADNGWCPSGRVFEAAACGTPLITDAWAGLDGFFTPGRELIVASDSRDVIAALEMDDAEAARIAKAARERVLAEHTCAHRARELESLLEEALAPQPDAA